VKKSDIHILILSSWYPTEKNPFLGNFVQRQAQLLGQRYEVTVVHTVAKDEGEVTSEKFERDGYREIIAKFNGNGHILARKKQERAALIKGIGRLENIDLIIGNVLLPRGWQFLVARKNFGAPVFYIEHGSYFREKGPFRWSRIHLWIRQQIRKKTTAVIAVSDVLKKDMQPHFSKRNIEVIGNHIDVDLFKAKTKKRSDKAKFLHVSTLDPNTKNPRGILEACALLKQETDQFKLTIICDEDVSHWKEYVQSKELNDVVEFIGPLQWHELVPHYQNADAFVLFSEYESFSIVLAEAWATGTPVISTSVGIASNMDELLGIQVEQNNSEDLKNAMLAIVNQSKEFNTEKLTAKAQEFSSESILNDWTNLIDKHVG
jgi:glycosyltransferase involved in cell wall biosynthesis